MGEVIQNTGQDFWQAPTVLEPLAEVSSPDVVQYESETCAECGSEYMISARFCHACGVRRSALIQADADAVGRSSFWLQSKDWAQERAAWVAARWRQISFPKWLHYLHFHEIQRLVGLPTASLIAFIFGLGCVGGAVAVSLFYRASNLAEFQAIQMWRIEWLLAATAAFVAGILLKTPSNGKRD
ncbi:MAG TPA: hypothetical protein VN911_08670 [Candidatus Acidoferrum sp.]|nr:hypothetical protein [Candidatus Acidoferrum sp.]